MAAYRKKRNNRSTNTNGSSSIKKGTRSTPNRKKQSRKSVQIQNTFTLPDGRTIGLPSFETPDLCHHYYLILQAQEMNFLKHVVGVKMELVEIMMETIMYIHKQIGVIQKLCLHGQ